MAKQVNSNIGHVPCDMCGTVAAVRKAKSEKLYYDCPCCGRITPNLEAGQSHLLNRAVIWGADGPGADCPRWIAEQWPWGKVMNNKEEALRPVNEARPKERPVRKMPPRTPAPPPKRVEPEIDTPPPEPMPEPEEQSGFTIL